MKKILTVFIVIIVVLVGITMLKDDVLPDLELQQTQTEIKEKLENNGDIYPFYSSIDDEYKEYYIKLCAGFDNYSEKILLSEFDTKSEMKAVEEWLNDNFVEIAYEQPDYFWLSPYSYSYEEIQMDEKYTLNFNPTYVIPEDELDKKREIYNKTVDEIVLNASLKPDLFYTVLYAYDTILENTEYDHDLADGKREDDVARSAYGCLVDGKTVCSGYTLAFTSIMQKLGLTCGAEFDYRAKGGLIKGDGHVWNYCKLEEDFYYFDLTWDDAGYKSDTNNKQYVDYTHDFFAITLDELAKSHEYLDDTPKTYKCTADKYNYYIYKELYCDTYDIVKVGEIMYKQSLDEYVVIKFSSEAERKRAEKELFENYDFYKIFPNAKKVMYSVTNSGLHLYFFEQ